LNNALRQLVSGLLLNEERETLLHFLAVLVGQPAHGHGLHLILDGLIEIARFSVGGGERAKRMRIVPLGEFACLGGGLDGLFAVADGIRRAGGEYPGKVVVGIGAIWVQPDGFVEVA